MEFPVVPFKDDSPMKLWPSLTANAFSLQCGQSETVFFYDSPPCSERSSESGSAEPKAAPVFVLVHGLGDEADSWRHVIPLLNARGFRVLAVDLPGFGRSAVQGKVNLKFHAKAVIKLIEAVLPDTQVFLAGSSLGSIVVEMAAFKRPDLVKGIVLVDGSIPGGPAIPGPLVVAKLLLSRKWYKAYRGNPQKAWRSLNPYYGDLDSMPEEDKDFLRQRVMARVESDTQERAFFATQRSLIWKYLFGAFAFVKKVRAYRGKILLIWGKKDKILSLSSAESFKALRSDIELEVIPDAGHLPHQEKPAETARLMADFAE